MRTYTLLVMMMMMIEFDYTLCVGEASNYMAYCNSSLPLSTELFVRTTLWTELKLIEKANIGSN